MHCTARTFPRDRAVLDPHLIDPSIVFALLFFFVAGGRLCSDVAPEQEINLNGQFTNADIVNAEQPVSAYPQAHKSANPHFKLMPAKNRQPSSPPGRQRTIRVYILIYLYI